MEKNEKLPYVGLRPYGKGEEAIFFGREREIKLLINQIFASRMLVIFAPSGVGKTSLLCAGVIPKLEKDDTIGVFYFNDWKSEYLNNIKTSLRKNINITDFTDDNSLVNIVIEYYRQTRRKATFIFDQLEEVLRYDENIETFWAEIAPLANISDIPVRIILSLREDYLGNLDNLMSRIPKLLDNRFRVEPLSLDSIRMAIIKPLGQLEAPIKFENELVERIIRDLVQKKKEDGYESRIEPGYLQIVCMKLYLADRESVPRSIRLSTYEKLRGSKGIFEHHFIDIIEKSLSIEEQEIFFAIVRHIVLPSGAKIAMSVFDLSQTIRKVDFGKRGIDILRKRYPRMLTNELPFADETHTKIIEQLLKKLSGSDLMILRRKQSSIRGVEYEICHDMIGVVLNKWKESKMMFEKWESKSALRRASYWALTIIFYSIITMTIFFVDIERIRQRTLYDDKVFILPLIFASLGIIFRIFPQLLKPLIHFIDRLVYSSYPRFKLVKDFSTGLTNLGLNFFALIKPFRFKKNDNKLVSAYIYNWDSKMSSDNYILNSEIDFYDKGGK